MSAPRPPYWSAGESLCDTCGRIFGSVGAFDLHMPGDCLVDRVNRKGVPYLRTRTRTHLGQDRTVWVTNNPTPAPQHRARETRGGHQG